MAESGRPAVGEEAPTFTAPLARPSGGVEDVPLQALLADQPVLLVFHAAGFDLESLCDRGAVREFDWFTFEERVRIVGVSRAPPATHGKIIDHLELDYPFYSDRDLSIAAAYGARYRVWGIAPRARQSCFLVDGDGIVRFRWMAGDVQSATSELPQLSPLYETIGDVVGEREPETFGFAPFDP